MKRFAIAVLALVVVGLMTVPASAQVNLNPNRLGDLYLSAIDNGYQDYWQEIPTGVPFNFYLIADIDFGDLGDAGQNLTNGISAWEAQITHPADMFILQETLFPQGTALNVGTATGNVREYLVGTGSTLSVGGPQILVTFNALRSAANNETIKATIGPVAAPSVAGEAVWVEASPLNGCQIGGNDENCIFRFESIGDLRMSSGVSDDVETFGSLKARF